MGFSLYLFNKPKTMICSANSDYQTCIIYNYLGK